MQSPFSVERVAAHWYCGKTIKSDWPGIARDALEAGFDGPSLRRLAGLQDMDRWEISKFVEPALSELGAKELTVREAFDWLAHDICANIVGGGLDPFQGAGELASEMLRLSLSYPGPLWHLFSEIELQGTGALPEGEREARERILAYAAEYLGLDAQRLDGPRAEDASLYFQNENVRLHAVAAGPADGPAVVLLHGFPEFWYGWHRQIEPLAAAGFRVVVPDQRGYNLSSKPAGTRAYAIPALVSDVINIADQLGQKKIYLAGHDWGAAVAWSVALLHPERVGKLVILNVPHPKVMRRFLSSNLGQLLRSWYMFFFQLPWLPEALFRARNFAIGTRALVRSSRPGTFSEADLALYRKAWSQPGALTAMIHWYRAAFRHRPRFVDRTVRVPVRILWGERDAFLRKEMAQASLRYCTMAELFTFADSSHWLQHEQPERVSQLLIDFFRS